MSKGKTMRWLITLFVFFCPVIQVVESNYLLSWGRNFLVFLGKVRAHFGAFLMHPSFIWVSLTCFGEKASSWAFIRIPHAEGGNFPQSRRGFPLRQGQLTGSIFPFNVFVIGYV